MKIMVTGSAGYIGQPLVQMLSDSGHDVTGIDMRPGPSTLQADIRDLDPMIFTGIDAIVHLAGVSFAPEWTDADDIIWDANVEGTRRLVEHCEAAGVSRFIFASSASIFEGTSGTPATLDTAPMPVSAYGRSKACGERIVRGARLPQRIALRKGTLCGLGPNPRLDLVLNAMTLSALREGTVHVNGTGDNNRPMLRLSRAVRAYYNCATHDFPEGAHLYNLCDNNVTVRGLAEAVSDTVHAKINHREYMGRPRSYVMRNEHSPGLPIDMGAGIGTDVAKMAEEVATEMRDCLDSLPVLSSDPRIDRLSEINQQHRDETPA